MHGLYTFCITFLITIYLSPPCRTPDLSDLAETFPSVGHSLEELLKYNGDNFTTTFDLNFTVSFKAFLFYTYFFLRVHVFGYFYGWLLLWCM